MVQIEAKVFFVTIRVRRVKIYGRRLRLTIEIAYGLMISHDLYFGSNCSPKSHRKLGRMSWQKLGTEVLWWGIWIVDWRIELFFSGFRLGFRLDVVDVVKATAVMPFLRWHFDFREIENEVEIDDKKTLFCKVTKQNNLLFTSHSPCARQGKFTNVVLDEFSKIYLCFWRNFVLKKKLIIRKIKLNV